MLDHEQPGRRRVISRSGERYENHRELDWNIARSHKLTLSNKHINADYTDGITRTNTSFALTGVQFDRP